MPNYKSVVHFLQVDFGEGCVTGGKTKSTPSLTDLDWTFRLDWSLTIAGISINKIILEELSQKKVTKSEKRP